MSGGGGFLASVGALSAARAAALASQILVLPILARYLSPAEFGVVALAVGVAGFANLFSDAGMGRSLIRTPLSASDEWSSVFWFLTALGLVLTCALLGLAPLMVWFFDEPLLFEPLVALSTLPLMLAVNAAFAAEMEQRRAFAEIALSQTVGTAIALVAAVWLAVSGFGLWALVVQQLLMTGVRAIWVGVRSQFRPRMYFSRKALGAHFVFGRDITAASILGYIREQSTTLVVGKVLGAADLGLFAMTQRFARLPMFGLAGPFGQVLYVRLTRVAEDREAFREVVLSAMRLLGFAALPGMAAIAMIGETAFTLVLSERWAPVAPIFAAIAGGAALRAATHPTAIALTALGLTGRRLRLTAEITVFWLVLLSATVTFGLIAIAAAHTLWMLLQLPRHWAYLSRACELTAGRFLRALAPGAVAAGVVAASIVALDLATGLQGWLWLGLAAAASLIVFLGAVVVCRRALYNDLRHLRG